MWLQKAVVDVVAGARLEKVEGGRVCDRRGILCFVRQQNSFTELLFEFTFGWESEFTRRRSVKGDAPSLSLLYSPYLHNSLYNNLLQCSELDCTRLLGNNALVTSDLVYLWLVPLTRRTLTITVAKGSGATKGESK
jgi:hypothetical protein